MMRFFLVAVFTLLPLLTEASPIRLKDLVEFDGVRGNDLVGYGLVVGLNGTGDGLRNAPFTEEIMSNILERLGVNVTGEQYRTKNVAAVIVTASLPHFARASHKIDINVAGVVPDGARVEREIAFDFSALRSIRLALRTPDFTTASRIERAINSEFGRRVAVMSDAGTVELDIDATRMPSPAHALGRVENILVEPERRARVVVDQRSGTIVMV